MIYYTENDIDRKKAIARMKYCLDNKKIIELTVKNPIRSLKQNAYVHVLFGLFGMDDMIGSTIDEAKEDVSRELGYTYKKNGNEYRKKTSLMDSKELTEFIDKFRHWSSIEHGIYLPTPEEYIKKSYYYDNEVKKGHIY